MHRLTPDHARRIGDRLGPTVGYLWRMLGRLDATDLRLRDPRLYALVVAARDTTHALTVELHYPSYAPRVGRPAPPAPPADRTRP